MEVHSEELSARRNRNFFVKTLLFTFCLLMVAFVSAYLTTVFSVKPTIDNNSTKRQEQQLCTTRLNVEYEVAVSRAILSAPGSEDRAHRVDNLNRVIEKLEQVDHICFNQTGG